MSESVSPLVPRWFWIVAAVALVWNLIGVMTYLMYVTMSPDALAQLPPEQQSLREATPAFVTGAYAIAVFSGSLGSLFLLLRKNWAILAFVVSFVALLVQFGYSFLAMNTIAVMGAASAVLPAIIIIVGLLLLRFSISANRHGWLRSAPT